MTHQLTLDGNSKFIGSDHDKALHILAEHPDSRNSYRIGIFYWWLDFDGLEEALKSLAAFKLFLRYKATPPHTIRNRIQEIQNQYPHLDASEEVEEYRQKRSKQGVLE